MLEAQIAQQATSSSILLGRLPSKNKHSLRKQCNAMILKGGKKLEGPKGFGNDVNLCDDVVEKEVFSPSNDVNDDVVSDVNEVPKDPKQTSQDMRLPFPQRIAKAKRDLQFEKF